jgi:hypothetical protein
VHFIETPLSIEFSDALNLKVVLFFHEYTMADLGFLIRADDPMLSRLLDAMVFAAASRI